MNKPILYYPNGDQLEVQQPKNSTDFKLEELYELLECDTIQVLPMGDNNPERDILIGDDNAKLADTWETNRKATEYWLSTYGVTGQEPGDNRIILQNLLAGRILRCHTSMLR